MFEEVFNSVREKNEEVYAIGVWGKDGLELEKKYFQEIENVDLEFSGAELADIISKLDNTKTSPHHFFIRLNYQGHYLQLHSLTPDLIHDQPDLPGRYPHESRHCLGFHHFLTPFRRVFLSPAWL